MLVVILLHFSSICKCYELVVYQTFLHEQILPWWVTSTVKLLLNTALFTVCHISYSGFPLWNEKTERHRMRTLVSVGCRLFGVFTHSFLVQTVPDAADTRRQQVLFGSASFLTSAWCVPAFTQMKRDNNSSWWHVCSHFRHQWNTFTAPQFI